MNKRTTMDAIHTHAKCLAAGAVLGWLAVGIGGVTGVVVSVLLMATYFMVSAMHMQLHYKLWGEFLDETGDAMESVETNEEAEAIWAKYNMVAKAVYHER